MQKSRGYKLLRRGRWSEPGTAYLVTTVVRERRKVFSDLNAGRCLVRILMGSDRIGASRTLAYVVMPDHLHWLFILGDRASLSRTVASVKVLSAKTLGASSLWQPGFHDRALRREDDLRPVARYVVANPLRSGIVEHLGEYPLWDAAWVHGQDVGL